MSQTKAQRRPAVGDRAWCVDWCAGIPIDPETGDGDIDNADDRTEVFWTKAKADKRANEVAPHDAWGQAGVTHVEFTAYDENDARRYPHVGFWEPMGEPEYIEAP